MLGDTVGGKGGGGVCLKAEWEKGGKAGAGGENETAGGDGDGTGGFWGRLWCFGCSPQLLVLLRKWLWPEAVGVAACRLCLQLGMPGVTVSACVWSETPSASQLFYPEEDFIAGLTLALLGKFRSGKRRSGVLCVFRGGKKGNESC